MAKLNLAEKPAQSDSMPGKLRGFEDLTIARKGFILVAVPLFTGLVAVSILLYQLDRSEQELQRESRSKEVHSLLAELDRIWVDGSVAAGSYAFWKQQVYKDRFLQDREKSIKTFARLSLLAADDPERKDAINRLSAVLDRLDKVAEALVPQEETNELRHHINVMKVAGKRLQLQKTLDDFRLEFGKYQESLRDSERVHSSQAPAARERVRTSVVAFGLLTLLISAYLSRFYSRSITQRLEIVTKNALRLAARSPLQSRVPGHDEIARLDEVFHQMASAIKEAAIKARAITDNAVDVICAIDSAKRFVEINPACQKCWDFAPEELIGKRFADLLVKEDIESTIAEFNRAAATNTNIVLENQVRKRDGSPAHIRWSVSWSQERKTYYCLAHDVTMQHEIERLKQEFVAMVSHDLRAPLTSLQAALALFETGEFGALNQRGLKTVKRSLEDLARLIGLIDGLLDIEKMKAGEMHLEREVLDVALVVSRSVNAISHLAETSGIKIQTSTGSVEGFGDSAKLIQVVVNLLSNAIKFSPAGSTINVEYFDTDEFFEVKVKDQGRGVPTSRLKSVFNRFEQVELKDHTEKGGKGLGLAICKSIVEAHGGTIGVESEEGVGSTFWFRIPQPQ